MYKLELLFPNWSILHAKLKGRFSFYVNFPQSDNSFLPISKNAQSKVWVDETINIFIYQASMKNCISHFCKYHFTTQKFLAFFRMGLFNFFSVSLYLSLHTLGNVLFHHNLTFSPPRHPEIIPSISTQFVEIYFSTLQKVNEICRPSMFSCSYYSLLLTHTKKLGLPDFIFYNGSNGKTNIFNYWKFILWDWALGITPPDPYNTERGIPRLRWCPQWSVKCKRILEYTVSYGNMLTCTTHTC